MNRVAHRQLARVRLKWVQAKHAGLSYYKVGRKFHISPSTVRLWYLRWKASGYRFDSLYNSRPKRGTPANARRDIEADLRALYASGLRSYRLQKALKRRGHTVARSTLYATIKRLGLAEPPAPKPKRKTVYRTIEWPLGWIQADTMWPWGNAGPVQYTAIECCSRVRFLRLYPDCSPEYAAEFILRALLFFPFTITVWHTDSGSEWTDAFGHPVRTQHPVQVLLQQQGIAHHVVVGRPSHQGRVERSHRIDREEFYRIFDPATARASLAEWVHAYNEVRLHGGIGYRYPKAALEELLRQPVVLNYDLCK